MLLEFVLVAGSAVVTVIVSRHYYRKQYADKNLLLEAFELYSRGDSVAFLQKLRQLRDSRVPLAHWMRGTTYYNQGRVDEAIHEFNRQLASTPSDFQLNFNMALIMRHRQLDQCFRYFERALNIYPTHFSLNFNYALAVHEHGRRAVEEDAKRIALSVATYHYVAALETLPEHQSLKINLKEAINASDRWEIDALASQIEDVTSSAEATELRRLLFDVDRPHYYSTVARELLPE